MNIKRCSRCKQDKNLSEYYRHISFPEDCLSGYSQPCIECKKQLRDKTDIAKLAKYQLRWKLSHRYGLSVEDYEWLFNLQLGCWICGKITKVRHIDHDHLHEHGTLAGCVDCIRGLLCPRCNMGFIPTAEANPILQTPFVSGYLKSRPFRTKYNVRGNS